MQSLWLKLWKISGQAIDHKVGFINICILNRQLILISCLFFTLSRIQGINITPIC